MWTLQLDGGAAFPGVGLAVYCGVDQPWGGRLRLVGGYATMWLFEWIVLLCLVVVLLLYCLTVWSPLCLAGSVDRPPANQTAWPPMNTPIHRRSKVPRTAGSGCVGGSLGRHRTAARSPAARKVVRSQDRPVSLSTPRGPGRVIGRLLRRGLLSFHPLTHGVSPRAPWYSLQFPLKYHGHIRVKVERVLP